MGRLNFVWFICLFGCSSGVDLLPVSKESLLNDMNSKVWLVDQVLMGGNNFAPRLNVNKDVLVFYQSGKCLYQPLRTLGELDGKRGVYSLRSEDMDLSLYFRDEIWCFKLSVISEDTLLLEPRQPTNLDYTLVLTPFPEL
jgi:hypothetical protein